MILIAFIIILVILIIFNDFIMRWISDRTYTKISADKYDWNSTVALNSARFIKQPSPNDEIRIARIIHHNRNDINTASKYYRRALKRIIENPPTDVNYNLDKLTFFADDARRRYELQRRRFNIPPPITQETVRIANEINETIPVIRRTTETKTDMRDNIEYHTDNQNVHDSKINKDLQDHITKIKEQTPHIINSPIEYLRNIILTTDTTPQKKAQALDVIDRIEESKATVISVLDKMKPMTELEILCLICNRAEDKRNENNKRNIQLALIDALSDCVEPTGIVCVNGRIGHIVSAFATLDFDEVGMLRTKEMMRNECFERACVIRDRILANPDKMADYNLGKEEVIDEIGKEINLILRNEYSGKVPHLELETIIQTCKNAI